MTTVERINTAVSTENGEWKNSPTCECGHVSFRHHERKGDCDGLGRNPFGSKCECKEYRPKRTPLPWATDGALAMRLFEEMPEPELYLESDEGELHQLWGCVPRISTPTLCAFGHTTKFAIALAWLRLHNIDITEG